MKLVPNVSSMYAPWGTSLFRHVYSSLAILYGSMTLVMIAGIYWLDRWGVSWWIITILAVMVSWGIGRVLARVALSPLMESFEHWERFARETLHELNLPLTTITMNLQMVRQRLADPKALARLDRIEMATQMLYARYEELEYWIKRQMEKEEITSFEVGALVQERYAFLHELYPQVEWSLRCEETWVCLDRMGLAKVIDNLIDNAIKYTPQSPCVWIDVHAQGMIIRDRGRGMDEITLMRIYDRYYQANTMMAGYGIGLSLVKRYCDHHEITLHITSRVGEGTQVQLEWKKEKNRGCTDTQHP